jgi:hypothetical protein
MEKFLSLFQEFTVKAVVMTENFLDQDLTKEVNFDEFTHNRERLFQIIDQISREINWSEVELATRDELNRQIDYIKKLDEKILVKLQEYQAELRQEIENTVRQKESVKGYNLNDVK